MKLREVQKRIEEIDFATRHRISGKRPGLHRLANALLNRLDELSWNDSTGNLVVEYQLFFGGRPEADLALAELAPTARLTNKSPLSLGFGSDCLFVGNLRPADVGAHVELSDQAIGNDLQMKLAHT